MIRYRSCNARDGTLSGTGMVSFYELAFLNMCWLKNMKVNVTKSFYNRPSAFINAFFTCSNSTVAMVGGTALPICLRTPTEPNL